MADVGEPLKTDEPWQVPAPLTEPAPVEQPVEPVKVPVHSGGAA